MSDAIRRLRSTLTSQSPAGQRRSFRSWLSSARARRVGVPNSIATPVAPIRGKAFTLREGVESSSQAPLSAHAQQTRVHGYGWVWTASKWAHEEAARAAQLDPSLTRQKRPRDYRQLERVPPNFLLVEFEPGRDRSICSCAELSSSSSRFSRVSRGQLVTSNRGCPQYSRHCCVELRL